MAQAAAKKILAIDDEPDILKIISLRLAKEGFEIVKASDGEEALKKFFQENPNLVILDLMLPKLDGFEVCRLIRESSNVPIIILSAKGDEIDKLMGFRLGSDDYLVKPFSPSELLMRVKAVLRRTSNNDDPVFDAQGTLIIGPLTINRRHHTVKIGERNIQLTPKEFELLWLLSSHPNCVFTREEMLQAIWNSEYLGDAENVTVMVSRLREKLEQDPANPVFIKTIWGIGYKFSIESQ